MVYRPTDRIFTPSAPTGSVVMLAEMKQHLRVSHAEEDALIGSMIAAAVSLVEKQTQRLLSRRSAVLRLADLPADVEPIELPGGAVGSVTSIVVDQVTQTLTTSVVGDSPALLVPAVAWPAVTGDGYPVVITYQAGYAAPEPALATAVRLIAAELYERRSVGSEAQIFDAPMSVKALIAPYRIRAF